MKTCFRWLTFTAVLAMLAVATSAFAQGRGGFRGGPGGNQLGLLSQEPIQKELNLTAEQKSSIAKLSEEEGNLSREERRQKMSEIRKQVTDLLSPEQKERLDQIGLQLAGARALVRPEVADKLGLSEEQKDKLNELFPFRGGGFRGGPGGAPPEGNAGKAGGGQGANTAHLSREELNTKAMEILTADQREKFEQMKGKKIGFDPAKLSGFGRGPGG